MLTLACNSPMHLIDGLLPLVVLVGLVPVTWASARIARAAAARGTTPDGPTWGGAVSAAFDALPLGVLGAMFSVALPRELATLMSVPLPLAVFLTAWLGGAVTILALSRAPVPALGEMFGKLLRVLVCAEGALVALTVLFSGGAALEEAVVFVAVLLGGALAFVPFMALGAAVGRRRALPDQPAVHATVRAPRA